MVLLCLSLLQTSHSYFVHDLGIPAWGSYLVFAFATVLSGLLLGLVSTSSSLFFKIKLIEFILKYTT
jgi:hypothetical protein